MPGCKAIPPKPDCDGPCTISACLKCQSCDVSCCMRPPRCDGLFLPKTCAGCHPLLPAHLRQKHPSLAIRNQLSLLRKSTLNDEFNKGRDWQKGILANEQAIRTEIGRHQGVLDSTCGHSPAEIDLVCQRHYATEDWMPWVKIDTLYASVTTSNATGWKLLAQSLVADGRTALPVFTGRHGSMAGNPVRDPSELFEDHIPDPQHLLQDIVRDMYGWVHRPDPVGAGWFRSRSYRTWRQALEARSHRVATHLPRAVRACDETESPLQEYELTAMERALEPLTDELRTELSTRTHNR